MLQPLIMVVNGNREITLRAFLADHIIIKRGEDFRRSRHFAFFTSAEASLGLFADDIITKLNAFIADEHGGASDQLAHFVLRLPAEAAI